MELISKDFVFRSAPNGGLTFNGDFEGLYRAEADPWAQSATGGAMLAYYDDSRRRLREALWQFDIPSLLEVGCGHGHVTDLLATRVSGAITDGCDISHAAIAEARNLYPRRTFFEGDITSSAFTARSRYDCVVLSECFWYLVHALPTVLGNCAAILKPRGLLVVTQAFLKGEQRYARELADGFLGSLKILLEDARFALIEARYDDSGRLAHNHGLMILRAP